MDSTTEQCIRKPCLKIWRKKNTAFACESRPCPDLVPVRDPTGSIRAHSAECSFRVYEQKSGEMCAAVPIEKYVIWLCIWHGGIWTASGGSNAPTSAGGTHILQRFMHKGARYSMSWKALWWKFVVIWTAMAFYFWMIVVGLMRWCFTWVECARSVS